MKITEEYKNNQVEIIDIISAKHVGDYCIRITFSDGLNRVVDFKSFLESSSHPSIKKYLNETEFKQFKIIDGNLNWNDYDMIFPIFDLHEGNIS